MSVAPVRKRQKREDSSEDADAKLAAELQAQENRMARGRTTRGGNGAPSKATKKKKAPRKKSDKKVDDSDVEEGAEPPKRKAGGGFQKPFNLSEPLAELLGEPQVTSLFPPPFLSPSTVDLIPSQVREVHMLTPPSSPAHRSLRSSGSILKATIFRTPKTSGKSVATTKCMPFSNNLEWTCSR